MAAGNGHERSGLEQAILLDDPDVPRGIVERVLHAVLEEEMTDHLGAERYEQAEGCRGDRNSDTPRALTTRVGTLRLRVSGDRGATFSTEFVGRDSAASGPWSHPRWR